MAAKILIVTPELPPKVGGIGRSAQRLSERLAEAGCSVNLLTYDRSDTLLAPPFLKEEVSRGLRVLRVGPIASKFSGAEAETKAFLKRQFVEFVIARLRREGWLPDCVLSFGLVDAGFPGLCISQGLDVPHIVSARGADVGTELFQGDKFAQGSWVVTRSQAVTFVNSYLADIARAVFGRSALFRIVRNGVAEAPLMSVEDRRLHRHRVRSELQIPQSAQVIGWTGTFRPKKGLNFLDVAFRNLVESGRDLYCLIVGGPRNEKERALFPALDNDLRHRTRCVGLFADAADVLPFYFAMDLFAYPSLDDGLSNSLLEACAFGVPVVATDIFSDVLTHRQTALLSPRFDASGLEAAIAALLDDRTLAINLATAARALMSREFSPLLEAEAYLALIDEVIAAWRPEECST